MSSHDKQERVRKYDRKLTILCKGQLLCVVFGTKEQQIELHRCTQPVGVDILIPGWAPKNELKTWSEYYTYSIFLKSYGHGGHTIRTYFFWKSRVCLESRTKHQSLNRIIGMEEWSFGTCELPLSKRTHLFSELLFCCDHPRVISFLWEDSHEFLSQRHCAGMQESDGWEWSGKRVTASCYISEVALNLCT